MKAINNNNQSYHLKHCLRLSFRLQIDRVTVSWNPFSSNHDDHFQLSSSLLRANNCDRMETLHAISSTDINNIDTECIGQHYDIRFDGKEIIVRTAIIYDDPQSMNVVHFDNERRIVRLSLIRSGKSSSPSSSLLSKIFTIKEFQYETIGFVDIDLAEYFCQTLTYQSVTMLIDDNHRKHFDLQHHFCFQLSFNIECNPESSSIHYIGLQQYNADRCSQINNQISDRLSKKLSYRMNFSRANQRKHSIFNNNLNNLNNNNNNNNNNYNIMLTWFPRNHQCRLYRILIHFGHIEYLKTNSVSDGKLWASFRVKYDRHLSKSQHLSIHSLWKRINNSKQIYCRTKSYPFKRSTDGQVDVSHVGSFDESFVFFDHFDFYVQTAQTYLSLVLINDTNQHQYDRNKYFTFKCPLLDYVYQPSVNQYFCLESSTKSSKQRINNDQSSYCTLQFSIWIEPLSS